METGKIKGKRFDAGTSSTFRLILETLDLDKKKTLDLGCGFGEHLSMFGPGSAGITTTLEEVEYGKTVGLKIEAGNVELIDELQIDRDFEAVWANNLFEHLLSPHAFLMKMKKVTAPESTLVLGVPVVPKIVSLLKLRKFRGALATAHINFFTKDTLSLTVSYAGWKIITVRPFIFRNVLLDRLAGFIAPHQYVVAQNDSSFVYPDKKIKEWQDCDYYSDLLVIGGRKYSQTTENS